MPTIASSLHAPCPSSATETQAYWLDAGVHACGECKECAPRTEDSLAVAGTDLSVCVAIAVSLALHLREPQCADSYGSQGQATVDSKLLVRRELAHVCNSYPNAHPTRGNLKQVFHFVRSIIPQGDAPGVGTNRQAFHA
jgi:hypothetical protein